MQIEKREFNGHREKMWAMCCGQKGRKKEMRKKLNELRIQCMAFDLCFVVEVSANITTHN